MGNTLTRGDLAEILFATNTNTHERFRAVFPSEIEKFIDRCYGTYVRQTKVKVPENERWAWVMCFLYNAFNNLFTSFHLLVSGLQVPSGNLMRHYGESVAMALLCSHPQIEVFERLSADPDRFPVHDAINIARKRQNAKLLGLDANGWEDFKEITKWFDKYSHASALAVASIFVFSRPGAVSLGGEFDDAKIDNYRKEISLRISACDALLRTTEVAECHLVGLIGSNITQTL